MKVKNDQNSMLSSKTSSQQDKTTVRNLKTMYSVYPVNRMRRMSLEMQRAQRDSSPNVDELANALTKLERTKANLSKPQNGCELLNLINSDEISDVTLKSPPCQGLRSVKLEKKNFSSSTSSARGTDNSTMDSLKTELSKCKKELNDYNNATKELEQKYLKINVELGELQQTHERFIANRMMDKQDEGFDSCRDGSEFSLKRKCTHVFERGQNKTLNSSEKENVQTTTDSNRMSIFQNKEHKSTVEFTYCQQQQPQLQPQLLPLPQQHDPPSQSSSVRSRFSTRCSKFFDMPGQISSDGVRDELMGGKSSHLDNIYETLLEAMGGSQDYKTKDPKITTKSGNAALERMRNDHISKNLKNFNPTSNDSDSVDLEKQIANLKNDQNRYRNVIAEQQYCLEDYRSRCEKAKQLMESQQHEIQKLTSFNKDLQNEVNKGIDQLRQKVDAKLRQVAPLTERLNEEQARYQKLFKENATLREHKRLLQERAKDLKIKLDEINKKRVVTLGRLKNAERDLRVFRTYNAALKKEKAKNLEELKILKEKLDSSQEAHKRSLTRQRELNEKQCRDLQRRVHDLEQRLGRSNNSTSSLLQQRDRLISELQGQINTLVHNFEVSQKHIRLLRRHLHNAAGDFTNSMSIGANAVAITGGVGGGIKRKPVLAKVLM